ncbi:S-layer homology domain-containing protein [Paenibacillus filicis]|uniref:S-layer homology domain-containing protein n=1 Tax=Paenibacillus gyeongsangnamensis TaxID=3388067 RepID=A0ABT4QEC8_9BACL|nr:S-layer homology domain-containing protein [Paenibacillus filicis]MCZ8515152.1 S-layer homology domain-containing protein [Paenibacillus filicis]
MRKPSAILMLTLALMFAAISAPRYKAFAEEIGAFKDTAGHWAESEIREAVKAGYVSGYEDGTFKPERSVLRLEYLVMLVKLMQYPVAPAANAGAWYDSYVDTAKDLNLVPEGMPAEAWKERLTRSEMLRMAYGLTYPEEASPAESDINEWARAESLLNGGEGGVSGLEQTATRAQTVVFLERLRKLRSG